ncbi:hypothetical protein NEUTE2DRAFT_55184 [Neurospora tetrasperma FGSC 2509]|nr:hypothetical protein NEUTE2DRAFT_55184 [Neurospora tetrasperma FGSC 2509]
MLPDGDALLWRSSLVLASGRSDDSSVHFPTHTRHSQASLIQEQVGTGAVVISILITMSPLLAPVLPLSDIGLSLLPRSWHSGVPRAKLYGFHVVDHPKGGDGAGIPSEPSWRDVGTVPATEPSQRQRAAGEQPAGAEDSQESTQDSTRPSDRVQIEMSGPNRVKRIVPEG